MTNFHALGEKTDGVAALSGAMKIDEGIESVF
jgi:hypothetical protein